MQQLQEDVSGPRLWDPADTQPVAVGSPSASAHPAAAAKELSLWAVGVAALLALVATAVAIIALVSSHQTGAQGPAGPQGAQGLQGVQGPQGTQGIPGVTGAQGAVGPRGPVGATGRQGLAGAAGQPGIQGARGAQGPSGTIASSTPVSAPVVVSSIDPPVGSAISATASCPAGQVLLAGGAQITGPPDVQRNVMLRASYPTIDGAWRTVAVVIAPLGITDQATLHPYVLCGKAS
jgi:Collagen triple helix repeat (20 copies)